MRIQRTQNATRNIAFGIIYRIVTTIWPFAIRTIMLKTLGAEYLGLSSLFSSLLSFLSLAELGIGSAMVYAMYKPIAEDYSENVNALLNLYKKLYRIIGLIIFTIGIILLPFLDKLIKGSYPADINLYLLYLIYLFNTVISYFLFAYKQSLLTAYQRVDIISKSALVIQSLMFSFQAIVLLLFRNYYTYIIILPIATIFTNIVNNKIVDKMFPQYHPCGSVSKESELSIRKNVLALIGTKLNGIVIHFSDNIVVSAFLGLTLVAMYSNYYMIINAVMGITGIIYSSITAGLGNSIAIESENKNYDDFNLLTFMNFWLIGWFSICILCLTQPFMNIWVGKDLMFNIGMVVLFASFFYIHEINKIVITYKDAAGLWWNDRFRPYATMILNLASNIILVQIIGVYGIILSSVISMAISVPWAAIVLYKGLFHERSVAKYFLVITKYTSIVIIAGTVTYFSCAAVNISNLIIDLGIKTVICVILPNLILGLCNIRSPYLPNMIKRVKLILHR